MNEVISAEIIQFNKRERIPGGLYITFNSSSNVKNEDYVKLLFPKNNRPFQVVSVKVVGELLEVVATEAGYFARKLKNMPDLDLRSLIGIQVIPIVDEKEISKIKEESCWC